MKLSRGLIGIVIPLFLSACGQVSENNMRAKFKGSAYLRTKIETDSLLSSSGILFSQLSKDSTRLNLVTTNLQFRTQSSTPLHSYFDIELDIVGKAREISHCIRYWVRADSFGSVAITISNGKTKRSIVVKNTKWGETRTDSFTEHLDYPLLWWQGKSIEPKKYSVHLQMIGPSAIQIESWTSEIIP